MGDWMGSTPDVTWIMPVKNGKPYVRATLESVAAQQYGPHRIIAWDNGSSDGTQDELLAWIPSRIAGEVILDRPLPLGRCRAALVERAKSEFIACIDADDLADPRRLTVQIAYLVARPDLVALGCIPEIIDEAGAELDAWYYPESDAEIRWRSNWQTSLNASSVVFRRSAVLRAGNYRDIDFGEDLDLWMRLTALGRIENIGERLVKYRRHTQNTSVGVTDYYAVDRAIALRNAAHLFPGLDADESIELWEAAYPRYGSTPVRFHHVRLLGQVARNRARRFGEPDDYFVRSSYFSLQKHYMLKNIFRSTLGLNSDAMHRLDALRSRLGRRA